MSTTKTVEPDERVKRLMEQAAERKKEAEEMLKEVEAEEAEDEAEERARIERMAAAETRVVEQMAKEKSGKKPKTQNSQSQDASYFPPELEKLISMALEDGEISEKEHDVLRKKAQALGIDPDELDMVLGSKLEKQQSRKLNSGKDFIENLKQEMNEVCVL